MSGAGEAVVAAAMDALGGLEGVAVYDGAPVQAAFPHVVVECGPESDWGWKGGGGRELRLAAVVRDKGERPERVRVLMGEVEAALGGLSEVEGWRMVNANFVRARVVRERAGPRAGVVEFRMRVERV